MHTIIEGSITENVISQLIKKYTVQDFIETKHWEDFKMII